MSTLEIRIRDGKTAFRPGETVEGSVRWQLDKSAKTVEARLIWFTQGKGDSDVSVEQTEQFQAPSLSGDGAFRFTLPDAPYSFSGRLISLTWAVELVALPGLEAERSEFVLSSNGQEVALPEGAAPVALNTKQMPDWLKSRVEKRVGKKLDSLDDVRGMRESNPLKQENPFDS